MESIAPPLESAYRQSVAFLLQLHRLSMEGKNESEEADEIRADSEQPWWKLSEEEKARIRSLSADLKTIEPEFLAPHPKHGGFLTEESKERIEKRLQLEEWSSVLDYLSQHPQDISADLAAYYRGLAWTKLGEREFASRFFIAAAELNDFFLPAAVMALLQAEKISLAENLNSQVQSSLKKDRTWGLLNRFFLASELFLRANHSKNEPFEDQIGEIESLLDIKTPEPSDAIYKPVESRRSIAQAVILKLAGKSPQSLKEIQSLISDVGLPLTVRQSLENILNYSEIAVPGSSDLHLKKMTSNFIQLLNEPQLPIYPSMLDAEFYH